MTTAHSLRKTHSQTPAPSVETETLRVILQKLSQLREERKIEQEQMQTECRMRDEALHHWEEKLNQISRSNNISNSASNHEIPIRTESHREVGFSPVRLARYTLALNAMCMDPRQFHGHDLIGTLQHHEPPTDYEFTLTALAACSAQAHVRKRQMRRLLDIASAPQNHNIDTIAMLILVLRCISQDHRHRNIRHIIRKPSTVLAQQQRHDGSFGDLHTTALVMQALEEVENEPADNWNRSAALAWLISQQRPDGSFHGDVRATAEAILSVTPRGLTSIRTLDCGQGLSDNSPPRLTTSNNIGTSDNHSETALPSEASESNVSNADTTVAYTSAPVLVNVSYTLWVGSNVNETYNLTVTAPKNETFYGVMLLAAEMSPHFEFLASEWPNGHYVHTLAGYKEEPMSYHYWLLYRLPSPPEPSSPPGNQLVAPGGVDNLQISEGEHYLFWYKKL
ncbi:uncharacterized protein CG3556-like [Formica exsecta]|uniref:uncharacterized protein CG3556-like n=1 Tax=Formica exsecta TaxID=72781 RepID=UPI0011440043|nr:uncharacterized protein CG3556-like [Formica exsecta]